MIIAVGASGSKAGKTTFCNLFLKYVHKKEWQFLSTSETLIEQLAAKTGISADYIRAHKEHFRPALIELSKSDPLGPLYTTMLAWDTKKHLLVESVRKECEFNFLKGQPGVVFFYIETNQLERERRGAGEQDINEVRNLFLPDGEICKNGYLIYNNGSPNQLESRAKELAELAYKKYVR